MKINLTTSDNMKLVGNHSKVHIPSPGISLFHMMPSVKESYDLFAEKLSSQGIGVVAVDLRGHGESQDGTDGYKFFSDKQHQTSIEDVKAAINFQDNEGHSPLFVCGASIGANLALQIIVHDHRVKKAVLLSPGLNYKGIETIPLAKMVPPEKEIYLVAAKDDVRTLGTCAEQGQQIFDFLNCKKKIKIFDVGGHGTNIFSVHPGLMDELVRWLNN